MPFSAAIVLALTTGLLIAAFVAWRARRTSVALVCIMLAGASIRFYGGTESTLHEWDERFHAVVAKHLIQHPLVPTLYDDAALPYDYQDWGANHIWLHKPPVTLWLMAASMFLFGVHVLAVRLPDLLLSTLAIGLTFALGRKLFDERVALLAAAFHSVNGLLIELASGRAPVDHVDSLLIVWVELGALLALLDAERDSRWIRIALGLVLGVAVLTKWYPALLIIPLWMYLVVTRRSYKTLFIEAPMVLAVATVVAGPWIWYISRSFPREAEWEILDELLVRFGTVVGGRTGNASYYIVDMPKFFGELVYIPLAVAAFETIRRRDVAVGWLLLWAAMPYGVFSFAATKMPAYVMICAPAVFLIEAWFWWRLAEAPGLVSLRAVRAIVLFVFAALPARYVLRPGGPFTNRDRHPDWVARLEALPARVTQPGAVLFNVPHPIEAMFYVPGTVYSPMPTAEQAKQLVAEGRTVLIYDEASGGVREWTGASAADLR